MFVSNLNLWTEISLPSSYIYSVDSSEQATANGEPAVTVQETQIGEGDGVAVIGEMELPQDSSEMKLLKEESRESRPETGEESDRGVFNPISEEVDNYPDAPAPYLVSYLYSFVHMDPIFLCTNCLCMVFKIHSWIDGYEMALPL